MMNTMSAESLHFKQLSAFWLFTCRVSNKPYVLYCKYKFESTATIITFLFKLGSLMVFVFEKCTETVMWTNTDLTLSFHKRLFLNLEFWISLENTFKFAVLKLSPNKVFCNTYLWNEFHSNIEFTHILLKWKWWYLFTSVSLL